MKQRDMKMITIRMTERERRALRIAALKAGYSLQQYALNILMGKLKRGNG